MKKISTLLLLGVALLLPLPAFAQMPLTMHYQGFLTSNTGVPITGEREVRFAIYATPTDGAPMWQEQLVVNAANGRFDVVLGNFTSLGLPFDAQYWLGIKVGLDPEMTPRQALAGSPYAMRAGRIDATAQVDGTQITGTITTATISGTTLTQLQGQFVMATQAPQVNSISPVGAARNFGTSITTGADGLPVIAYSAGAGNVNLNVVKCGNASCTAGNTITPVDTDGSVGLFPSIAIGVDGYPVIAYLDDDNDRLKVAKCANAACSSGATITIVDTGGVGADTSIAIGADGMPVISYGDTTNGDLKVVKCADAACSSGNTVTTVDGALSIVGTFVTSIAVGVDGLPVISYHDATNFDLKVAKCVNAACTGTSTITVVDGVATNVGRYSSIVIGMDGLPVISYHDSTNSDLKVAKCVNAACTGSSTVTTIDSAGSVGTHTSITIGADGLPIVSYHNQTNGHLKVAKCGNAACSADTTINTVDTFPTAGQRTSITIGADGLPVISYYEGGTGGLRVAKCTNAFCAPFFRRR